MLLSLKRVVIADLISTAAGRYGACSLLYARVILCMLNVRLYAHKARRSQPQMQPWFMTTALDTPGLPCVQVFTSVVEPNNSVLSTHSLLEHFVIVLLDNEAIYDICRRSYPNLNNLVFEVRSSLRLLPP